MGYQQSSAPLNCSRGLYLTHRDLKKTRMGKLLEATNYDLKSQHGFSNVVEDGKVFQPVIPHKMLMKLNSMLARPRPPSRVWSSNRREGI